MTRGSQWPSGLTDATASYAKGCWFESALVMAGFVGAEEITLLA